MNYEKMWNELLKKLEFECEKVNGLNGSTKEDHIKFNALYSIVKLMEDLEIINDQVLLSFSNLKSGDLVFFSLAKNEVVNHEGIYVGNNQFINAASSKGVTINTLEPYWQSAYVGAKRVLQPKLVYLVIPILRSSYSY